MSQNPEESAVDLVPGTPEFEEAASRLAEYAETADDSKERLDRLSKPPLS